jgi:hypothetical protein
MATESELRRICLGLPGAYEQASYNGTPSFRTRPRAFARILEDGERVALWVSDEDEKLSLVEAEPGVFSTTPHYDGYPIVLVSLGAIDADGLRALVTDSWRLRVSPKLLQELPPA